MAELTRASSFAKTFQKKTGRAKELLRQNLGKADKTKDEDFDEFVKDFNKQTCSATKLLKEVKNYHNCLKAMQVARNSLMEVICELYEPSWPEHDQVQVKSEILDRKFDEFQEAVNEHIIKDIIAYSELFPEVNKKITKRKNKLLDYDSCRHEYESLLNNPKKKEEAKVAKAKEQMIASQTFYDTINKELHDELPALYDSRITFLAAHLQALFHAEKVYHHEAANIFADLYAVVEKLADENRKGKFSVKTVTFREEDFPEDAYKMLDHKRANAKSSESELSSSEFMSIKSSEDEKKSSSISCNTTSESDEANEQSSKIIFNNSQESSSADDDRNTPVKEQEIKLEIEEDKVKPENPTVLYQVKAAFNYVAEDADELSFEPGDIINVIEFEDPDEQEEGWLMGFIGDPKTKGLFPSNFTKPI